MVVNNFIHAVFIHTLIMAYFLCSIYFIIQIKPVQYIIQIAIGYGNFLYSDCSIPYEKEDLFNWYAIAFVNKFLNKTVFATNMFAANFLRLKKIY